jgi:hypothetical protein
MQTTIVNSFLSLTMLHQLEFKVGIKTWHSSIASSHQTEFC